MSARTDGAEVLPSYAHVNMADLDRMASAAADRAVAGVALKQGDVEKLVEEGVEEGIKRFMERVGIDDVKEFRNDLIWLHDARGMKEVMVKQGLMAFVEMIVAALGTAIWLAIKGAK